jgi:DNA-directed RNA polymerase subunit K/omega
MRKMHDTTKENFESQGQNVYEAILVMGNRARQVNEHHKHILTKIHDEYQATVNITEDSPDEPEDIDIPTFSKPTLVSMNEMLDGEIKYDYLDPHESGTEEG